MHTRLHKPFFVVVLVIWPVMVFLSGPSVPAGIASLLIYGLFVRQLQFWAPVVGMVIGGAIACISIYGSVSFHRPETELTLLFAFMAGGTLLGWFAHELKRLDDRNSPPSSPSP